MSEQIPNIRIVLVGTSHPGNIGSTARAMKVMGLDRLVLVAPEAPFPSSRATALATSADDILQRATVVDHLIEGIQGCGLVLGTTARPRTLALPVLDPRTAAGQAWVESQQHEVAIVFGRESSGLTNDETRLCHQIINIPTSKDYHSLNLAQAVQVVCYEVHMAMLGHLPGQVDPPDWHPEPPERVEFYYQRLEHVLKTIRFLNPEQPKRLMQRLRRLYQRARPDENELNILNGILSATLEAARERPKKGD